MGIITDNGKYIPCWLRNLGKIIPNFILHFILYYILHYCILFIFIILHSSQKTLKYKLNESRTFSCCVRLRYGIVIVLMMLFYDGLNREPREDALPSCKQHGLPITSHTAIAVDKGVNELKFIVKNT